MVNELELKKQIDALSLDELKELAFKHLLSNEKARLRKIKMRSKNKEKEINSYEKN